MTARWQKAIHGVSFVVVFAVAAGHPWSATITAQSARKATIQETDLKEWLTYLSSDELQGRQLFTEGYGIATQYVAERLKDMGVKPGGDSGSYFQTVKQKGYRVTNNSSVTIEVPGQAPRTFKHGAGVIFATNAGAKQSLTMTGVEFVGAGLAVASPPHDDYRGRVTKGKLVVWMGNAPSTLTTVTGLNRVIAGRNRYALDPMGAKAVVGFRATPPPMSPAEEALVQAQSALQQANAAVSQAQAALAQARTGRGGRGGPGAGRGGAATVPADITTVQRIDNVIAPAITADDTFYEALLAGAPTKFAALKAMSDKGEVLPTFSLPDVKVTVNVDNTYDVVSTQLTKNVVGIVEGIDPKLKDTFVLFGAHLDHVGYRPSAPAPGGRGGGGAAPAPVTPTGEPDLIFNGADDDGSGSTGLMGIAKAFAMGPKPKRSVMFVWHSGEESGLQGSRYMADFPPITLDKIQAQFNIDMIGRNRDNNAEMADTVFVIGADRISTDLHNVVVEANLATAKPMRLDYEYNDPLDPNSFYTRSDHYSYAEKGIPIAFFFTGTHQDYHRASDSVEKILFPKLQRVAQMVYEAGFAVANNERTLMRDNLGPRSGKGFQGKIGK